MSFREKSAWISLISIALLSGFFYLHVPLTPGPNPELVRGMFYCILALVIIEVIAHVVVAARSPQDARTPKDEREQMIDLKATRLAHYVYVIGSLGGIATLHLGANKMAMGFVVLLAFVVAELVKNAARIVKHRHGV